MWNDRPVTAERVQVTAWVDYLTLTGEGTAQDVQAVYGDAEWPCLWIPRAEIVKGWV